MSHTRVTKVKMVIALPLLLPTISTRIRICTRDPTRPATACLVLTRDARSPSVSRTCHNLTRALHPLPRPSPRPLILLVINRNLLCIHPSASNATGRLMRRHLSLTQASRPPVQTPLRTRPRRLRTSVARRLGGIARKTEDHALPSLGTPQAEEPTRRRLCRHIAPDVQVREYLDDVEGLQLLPAPVFSANVCLCRAVFSANVCLCRAGAGVCKVRLCCVLGRRRGVEREEEWEEEGLARVEPVV
jgi:hypothetical protein